MGIQFTDVSIRTMIGQLPKIINGNNKNISDYVNSFYDDTNQYITSSVKATGGQKFIESNKGIFTNIQTYTIDIGDQHSKDNIVNGVEHNKLSNIYLDNNNNPITTPNSELNKFCHNANAIGIEIDGNVKSVYTILTDLINDVKSLKGYHPVSDSESEQEPFNSTEENPQNIPYSAARRTQLQEPNSFTFDQSILFANKTQIKRLNLPQYQYDDITSGFIYTYYDYARVLTVNDEHTASIKGIPGSVITIKFNDTKKKGFYRILLSRQEKKYLRISKDELIRLSLVCVDNNDQYGTSWDVNNYSVRNADDLIIERK